MALDVKESGPTLPTGTTLWLSPPRMPPRPSGRGQGPLTLEPHNGGPFRSTGMGPAPPRPPAAGAHQARSPVTSLISLILEPPLPIRDPHWLAGTTSRSVTGGLLVAGLLLMELMMSWGGRGGCTRWPTAHGVTLEVRARGSGQGQ